MDLRLKIIDSEQGIVFNSFVEYFRVLMEDGVMVINKNYSPIIEKLAMGEITIQQKQRGRVYTSSGGWMVVRKGMAELFLELTKEVK